MGRRRNERKGRPVAWAVTLVVIALLILGFFLWNRHEARDAEDAAVGPGPTTGTVDDVPVAGNVV